MSVFIVGMLILTGVVAFVWQVRYARQIYLWGGDGLMSGCSVWAIVLYFVGFVLLHGYLEFLASEEFRRAWEAHGVTGKLFRSSVRVTAMWLVLKSLLCGLTVAACTGLAPLFLSGCAAAVGVGYLRQGDWSGAGMLTGYAGWLFEGAPEWVAVWFVRLLVAAAVLCVLAYRDVNPLPWGHRLGEFVHRVGGPLAGFLRLLFAHLHPPPRDPWYRDPPPALPAPPALAVVPPAPADDTEHARVDAVLAKLATEGLESLTSDERALLLKEADGTRHRRRNG